MQFISGLHIQVIKETWLEKIEDMFWAETGTVNLKMLQFIS